MLHDIVALAQAGASEDKVRDAHPRIVRLAHRRRLMGAMRWMIASDELVVRIADAPSGFGCLTTEADHSQGRYAFSFPGHPGGVFMVKRVPHEVGEGDYVQQRLAGVLETAPLADQFKNSPLKIYVSIPDRGAARLIAEHPAWPERISIMLSELRPSASVLASHGTPSPQSSVRSTRVPSHSEHDHLDATT
jgi:hypothetical protein